MTDMPLPVPEDLTSMVLRTDFGDEAAWLAVRTAIDEADGHPHATYVSHPRFAGMSIETLIDEASAAEDDDHPGYVFLADAITMTDPSVPLLAVDLHDEPGRQFRVPAQWYPEISANLSIANMDFADFADEVDDSGTFRGWRD
ncbi:DUF6924 domain-containing protein [Streptomyces calvus]|uniref:DUF6924 domain-containing protein n=1 Tax=Streptomyces calvus TaxID=67282 RepID=UPI00371BE01F